MIERPIIAGVPFGWFTGDEVCAGNGKLRIRLETARIRYVLAVSCDHRVPAGAGHTIRADALARRLRGMPGGGCPPAPAPRASAPTTGPGSPSPTPVRDSAGC
jgi:hypothetical protein